MSAPDIRSLPTPGQLWKATGIAIVVALAVLILAVLPAEYGIDPSGIGRKVGLTKLAGASTDAPPPVPAAGPAPATTVISDSPSPLSQVVAQRPLPFRSDEMELTLRPGEGAEIKAAMRTGDQLVFGWTVDSGKVEFDMHGEATNAQNDEFTSYWKGTEQASGHGGFTAPFDGTHGWYWLNRGRQPVSVRVKVSGFFEKLFRPE